MVYPLSVFGYKVSEYQLRCIVRANFSLVAGILKQVIPEAIWLDKETVEKFREKTKSMTTTEADVIITEFVKTIPKDGRAIKMFIEEDYDYDDEKTKFPNIHAILEDVYVMREPGRGMFYVGYIDENEYDPDTDLDRDWTRVFSAFTVHKLKHAASLYSGLGEVPDGHELSVWTLRIPRDPMTVTFAADTVVFARLVRESKIKFFTLWDTHEGIQAHTPPTEPDGTEIALGDYIGRLRAKGAQPLIRSDFRGAFCIRDFVPFRKWDAVPDGILDQTIDIDVAVREWHIRNKKYYEIWISVPVSQRAMTSAMSLKTRGPQDELVSKLTSEIEALMRDTVPKSERFSTEMFEDTGVKDVSNTTVKTYAAMIFATGLATSPMTLDTNGLSIPI